MKKYEYEIKQLSDYSYILMEHIVKLLVYSDIRPNDVKGWIHTLAEYISKSDSIIINMNYSEISEDFLMSTLFGCMGDEVVDYRRTLFAFLVENMSGKYNAPGSEPYPEFEITPELSENLMKFSLDIAEATIPMLIDKEEHSISEYEEVVKAVYNSLSD